MGCGSKEALLKLTMMWILNRAREIILYPQKTWDEIKEEKNNRILIIYPLILCLIQPIAIIIGYGIVGLWITPAGYFRLSLINAFYSALVAYFLSLLGIGIMGFLILVLVNYFHVEGDIFSAMKLSVYSATAPLLAGIFQIIPGIKILTILGLYGLYLLYIGIPKIMKAPHEKESPFIFSVIIGAVVLLVLINALISGYLFSIISPEILTY